MRGQESSTQFFTEKGFANKLKSFARGVYNGPLSALNPILILPRIKTETELIFENQWSDSSYKPSEEEILTLKKHKAEEAYNKKSKFMSKHPYWTKFRQTLAGLATTFIILNSVAGINHSVHMHDGGVISYKTYTEHREYKLEKNQVRILNENVPFPHLAIQIGEKVYSYGQTHLTGRNTFEYFQAKKINEAQLAYIENNNIALPANNNKDTSSIASIKKGASDILAGAAETLGVSEWPRSVEAITLNLTEAEVSKLQRELELNMAKRYNCLLYTSPSPRDQRGSRMPSSA